MPHLTQKLSQSVFGPTPQVVTLALFLMVFAAGAALAQTKASTSNFFDLSASVIDTTTNTVVATIPVGRGRPTGVAITPNGATAYTANDDGTVSVISTASNIVVAG
jgi:YVTN family beta-propeller protein